MSNFVAIEPTILMVVVVCKWGVVIVQGFVFHEFLPANFQSTILLAALGQYIWQKVQRYRVLYFHPIHELYPFHFGQAYAVGLA